jgi:hypothetical protein
MRFCECGQPVFASDKKTRIGYCKSHQWKRTDTDKRSIIQKAIAKNALKKDMPKVRSLIVPGDFKKIKMVYYNHDEELEKWFDDVAKIIDANPFCWETGDFISKADYRSATSHIFPKSIFKSISTHPLNFLILSPRNGSHDKTHRLDSFSKMKIWPLACERFLKFEHLITEKHKYLNSFRELVNQTLK